MKQSLRKKSPGRLQSAAAGAQRSDSSRRITIGQLAFQLQPTEQGIAARHAEIARRYDRAETAAAWREVRSNLRMRECRVILRLWTEAGRPIGEIADVIAAGGELGLNGYEIGAVIGFTFADYKSYGAAVGRPPVNDPAGRDQRARNSRLSGDRARTAESRRFAPTPRPEGENAGSIQRPGLPSKCNPRRRH